MHCLFFLFFECFQRFEKSLGIITTVLNGVLLLLHCFIIYLGLGNPFNMITLLPIIVGSVFIITGNTLPRLQLKDESTHSHFNTWNQVARTISYTLFAGGFVMLFSVFLPQSFILVGFLLIFFLTILLAAAFIYIKYSQRTNLS
ncbi:hypothetical protein [Cytobacillus purgationiresistens]|uniref:Immunity protein SdpI n=1 Tax=Cytobacillus purgationiresistens TaxID=863449 RepID=A0ABU0APV2_9BACI|nr:hypothetical protein [Cytobacillus purgationiresistens]MDQ0272075.1 hypothetical protein [Cytobacillus purgationiresistens]